MLYVDLNCDMGEGAGSDHLLAPYISSANIACGYHAGDEETMRQTIELCLQHGIAIGAHPSFADRENFGRTEMQVSETTLYELVATQVALLQAMAQRAGARLHHVKPHGALYNMAAKDAVMSRTIARAVKEADETLILYGLSNSLLITEAEKMGLRTVSEVFADRAYRTDGSLVPRGRPGALIAGEQQAMAQVLQMVQEGSVTSIPGKKIFIKAETICLHGDGPHAVAFAQKISETLKAHGIGIKTSR